jgi:hypothetical protein
MNKYNAAVDEQEAKQAELAGKVAAKEARDDKRRILAAQNTAYAKSGVMTEGTPLLVESQTAADEEYNAMMTSYNYGLKSSQSLSAARQSRMMGKSARRAGTTGAGASLFTGAADMARIKMARSY